MRPPAATATVPVAHCQPTLAPASPPVTRLFCSLPDTQPAISRQSSASPTALLRATLPVSSGPPLAADETRAPAAYILPQFARAATIPTPTPETSLLAASRQ